jgi:Type II secretion system protein B
VSTILDALKRLDEETRTRDAKQVPKVMMGNGTATSGNTHWRRRVLWAGLALIVVGAISWWGYREGGDNVPAVKPSHPDKVAVTAIPSAEKKSVSMAPLMEKSLAKESQPSQGGVAVTPPKPVTSSPAKSPTRPTLSSDLPEYAERTKTNSLSPNPLSAKSSAGNRHHASIPAIDQTDTSRSHDPHAQPHRSASAATMPRADSIEADEKTPSPSGKTVTTSTSRRHYSSPKSSAPEPPSTKSPYANAEPLASDTLQVQAISWSDRPTKRVAVIDGRLLREGQSVSGYRVIQIRPENVIVEKAGKFWKLAFGSH